MNIQLLKKAEKDFLQQYPGGFNHPQMVALGKKHKMDQQEAFAKSSLSRQAFLEPDELVVNVGKLISRSSMISVFEKPKFRDMIKSFTPQNSKQFAETIYELIHGKEQKGFEQLVHHLQRYKLAKWSLSTIIQTYYRPNKAVFIKPTTAKMVIDKLGLDMVYHPTPTWDFYKRYQKAILTIKEQTDTSLTQNNPAFCGFLMMALDDNHSKDGNRGL